jgi:hypothetical protein
MSSGTLLLERSSTQGVTMHVSTTAASASNTKRERSRKLSVR